MKIAAKDKLGQKLIQMPQEELQNQPILGDEQQDIYHDMPPADRSKLENDFVKADLSYGDRLRIVDDSGKLYDVIAFPDNTIGIQELALKIEYGRVDKYNSWAEASAAVPGDYSVEKAITASKKIATLLLKVIRNALENVLEKANPYMG